MASVNNKWFELRVWVREAKNLENRKLIGSNAPYVEVSLGNEIKRTISKSSLNHAIWDEKLTFRFNKWEDLPDEISIKVKDENTLLPNPLLGQYNLKLDKMLFNNYQQQPNYTIQDGYVNLQNCNQGQLDFQMLFKYCDEFEPQCASEQKSDAVYNQQENISKVEKMDQSEVHVLPTLHLKDKPVITEKEVEINKPIEIKETVIHKEKPVIVEQPTIKEKHEHYREDAQLERKENEIIKESIHEQDVGNLDQEALKNLREQRKQEFMDTSPQVEHQKEQVQLDTTYREKPTQVNEKEVVYQQPVEIEKTHVEQIKPKVHEEVQFNKEHVYKKEAPEFVQEDPQLVRENQQQ